MFVERRKLELFAGHLHSSARVLRIHAKVDVGAEAHAEGVRRHFDTLDDGVRRPLRNTISNAGSTLGLANRYQAEPLAPW